MRRSCTTVAFISMLFAMINNLSIAQENGTDLKKEVEELKKGQQEVQKDLLEIKSLLSRNAAPHVASVINVKDVEIDLGNSPIIGSDKAKVMMIEISDYQCPYCGRYSRDTFPQIWEQYVNKGTIQYAVMDQPLPTHKMAPKAAEASHCANDQGKYWEIHKLMMSKQESLGDLNSYASALSLDLTKFEECLNMNKYKDQVEKASSFVKQLGIKGVPGFIIAFVDVQHRTRVKGLSFIAGAQPLAVFQRTLDQALASSLAQTVSH